MKPIDNNVKVKYIKLGGQSAFRDKCFSQNYMQLGFNEITHTACLAENWKETVRKEYEIIGKIDHRVVSRYISEIEAFYNEPETTLWITFEKHQLWWCSAVKKFWTDEKNNKFRKVNGKWSNTDILGKVLSTNKLRGDLLKTQAYRGTICKVQKSDYVIRKINGIESEIEIRLSQLNEKLIEGLKEIIKSLTPQDFEIFIELLFTRSGWQRIGVLGKTEKDIDMALLMPLTNERAAVQVKSNTDFKEYLDYKGKIGEMSEFNKFFFAFHSTKNDNNSDIKKFDVEVKQLESQSRNYILGNTEQANRAIQCGLIQWLIEKAD